MSQFESKALSKYNGNHPLFYKRYVDDTFLIFNDRDDCELFLEYINLEHKNIKFTLEVENDNCLPFLDVLVTRNYDGTISTSLYRKSTFSGLLMKFDSFLPQHFKQNLILGLLNISWKICSSQKLFYSELNIIKQLLICNGFPLRFINRSIKSFLNEKHKMECEYETVQTCDRRIVLMSLPYCGKNSAKISNQLHSLLSKVAPWAKLNLVFRPVSRLKKNLSKLKSVVPILNRSNVVYKLNCTDCNNFYIFPSCNTFHTKPNQYLP